MYVPFTGLGLKKGFRGNTWLKNRIQVFKQFVIPSLLNQTCQNFILWVSWRPEERSNSHVEELFDYLKLRCPFKVIFTYHGVCFWDDKYPDKEAYQRLLMSVHRSGVEIAAQIPETDQVLMTIQPSDDMYSSKAVEAIQEFFRTNAYLDALGFAQGYIINYATKEVAEYNPKTNPPFYTIRFPKAIFENGQKHLEYTGPYKSHEFVPDHLRYASANDRGFMVGTHGENISTVFNHVFKGRVLGIDEQREVLKEFGILGALPFKTRKSLRLLIRMFFNVLPPKVAKPVKKIYYGIANRF